MTNKKIIFAVLAVFLLGCQQIEEIDEKPIEITGSKPIVEEVDEEFDDGLDASLEELEEIESI